MSRQLLQNSYCVVSDALPEAWRTSLQVRRRMTHFSDVGIVFVHVPKVAGASVNEVLYGRLMGHFTIQQFRRWAPEDVGQLPTFSLVRNPWDRIVSAYRFVCTGRGVGGNVTAAIRHKSRYSGSAFSSFERFVFEWLAPRRTEVLDGVFRPQSLYLLDSDGKVALTHVGRLERMQETEQWLSETLCRKVLIPHNNRSGYDLSYRGSYTPKLIQAVSEIYADDINLFGYDF